MLPISKQPEPHQFNDYIINQQGPSYKLLSSQDRGMSSNSIYYQQNSLSRKKLTVISKDNSKPDLRGDYLMSENISSLSSTNRTKLQNYTHSPLRNTQSTHSYNQQIGQTIQSLGNSRIQRSKLKRPISPSPAPMTPTKVLKLKKSMMNQSQQQSIGNTSVQRSINNSVSRRKFQSQATSPLKITLQSHRRMGSTTSDVPPFGITNNENNYLVVIENIRKELLSLFNIKVLQFQSKIQHQQETIKLLDNRLNQNYRKLKQKQRIIEQLNLNRQRSKTFANNYGGQRNIAIQGINEPYLIKRIKDLQMKVSISFVQQTKLNKAQDSIDQKISILQCYLIQFNSYKLSQLKISLNKFLQLKSNALALLSQSVYYLDNKLIGRTQAIKQTLCELKQKVKQVQDTWTHKDTRQTKQSTTIGIQEIGNDNKNKNIGIRRVENKLKQITSLDDVKDNKIQNGSLQFSLTSYQQQNHKNKNIKNVYYDQNFNQMEDVSIGLYQNGIKDDSSRLTDDFYYPSSTNHTSKNTSRNISPIGKKSINQYYGKPKQIHTPLNTFKKKQQSPSLQTPFNDLKTPSQQKSSPSQTIIKISNQAIHKKIDCIKELIDIKKTASNQQIQKGQLRCYVDKTGYLKYSDSKTFVFDKKGNLIPCTDGQFWFLVTKGLIYGKKDDQQSRTMSFIQYDQRIY